MDSWNDDRLDELSGRVDAGFAKVDQEMKAGFARVDQEMKAGFARVDEKFERMYHVLIGSAVSVVVALLGCIIALIATHTA